MASRVSATQFPTENAICVDNEPQTCKPKSMNEPETHPTLAAQRDGLANVNVRELQERIGFKQLVERAKEKKRGKEERDPLQHRPQV